jgi:hypothetical protein
MADEISKSPLDYRWGSGEMALFAIRSFGILVMPSNPEIMPGLAKSRGYQMHPRRKSKRPRPCDHGNMSSIGDAPCKLSNLEAFMPYSFLTT